MTPSLFLSVLMSKKHVGLKIFELNYRTRNKPNATVARKLSMILKSGFRFKDLSNNFHTLRAKIEKNEVNVKMDISVGDS